MDSIILFLKSHVAGYMRRGKYVKPHERKGGATASAASGQLALFPVPRAAKLEPGQVPAGMDHEAPAAHDDPRRKFYVTQIRDKRVARLAGPFDKHDDALAHVDRAKAKSRELDPWSDFDAFGTAAITADEHKPGVLNQHLGIGAPAAPAPVMVTSRRRVRGDPLDGTHTELTLSNGKVARIQRMSNGSTMGLGGWHDLDEDKHSYLADTEDEAVKEILRRHSKG